MTAAKIQFDGGRWCEWVSSEAGPKRLEGARGSGEVQRRNTGVRVGRKRGHSQNQTTLTENEKGERIVCQDTMGQTLTQDTQSRRQGNIQFLWEW